MRYAIIDTATNLVEALAEYATPPSNPPQGFPSTYIAVADSTSSIGWSYANGVFKTNTPLPVQAQAALDASDTTVIRCYSAGVAVPADIQAYRVALRNIATGKDTTSTGLPTKPTDYPAGT